MRFIIVILILLSAGCSTIGEPFSLAVPPKEDKALVYLFRDNISQGGASRSNFKIDGDPIMSIWNSGYTWVHLTEGMHTFESSAINDTFTIPLVLEKGKTYYLGVNQDRYSYFVANVFKQYEEKEALEILKGCNYVVIPNKANKPIKQD